MAHTITTTITTNAAGAITGYGLSIEAATSGDPEEIAATIVASLEMIRQTIAASFAPASVPQITAEPPAPMANPPATTEEARSRFFVRYGEIVGGQEWADVQRYLRQPRRVEPATVESWIAAATAVRDRSRVQPAAQPARRSYGRH